MKIGLTGGLASGKSTVARLLADAGLVVVDADDLVADLYRSGRPGAAAVRDLFGDRFLDSDGDVDHSRLAEMVFADTDALHRLEARIHPLVRNMFERLAEAVSNPIVLEGTLLVEAGYAPDFDLLVTVEADPKIRLERAVARGLTPEEAEARLAAQGDGELRRRASHRILTNDGSLADLSREVSRLVQDIRAAAEVARVSR